MRFYLLITFLVLSKSRLYLTESITEKSPSLINETPLEIQNQLLELQDDVISITKAIAQVDDVQKIQSQFDITKTAFNLIKDKLENKQNSITNDYSKSALAMLQNQCDAISQQLTNLERNIEVYQRKQLNSTGEKLKIQKNYYSGFDKVIKNILSYSSNDSESLSTFLQPKTLVNDNKTNVYTSIRLVKALEKDVINKDHVDAETKSSAEDIVDKLYQSIRDSTLNFLKQGKFEKNGEIDNLTAAVYELDPSYSESIIEEFVQTSFSWVDLKTIFDTIVSHRFIQQRITGIKVLFWTMKVYLKLDDDVIANIASELHKINSDPEFMTLGRSTKVSVKRMIEALPICARNLFFSKTVCLWNKGNEEFLTAGNTTYKNDNKRRNIFSVEDPLPSSRWYVENIDEKFLFSNYLYPNEYLYAADLKFNFDNRYLFTWIPGNNTDTQSRFAVVSFYDYCFIQSRPYYEYIKTSTFKETKGEDLGKNYVFVWTPRTSIAGHEFHWQIRNCD